jgi:hypothetical protein|tara:strand:- start:335 stop:439 length:105 start_codon:yes stop_codon:yes gene_type:complete
MKRVMSIYIAKLAIILGNDFLWAMGLEVVGTEDN